MIISTFQKKPLQEERRLVEVGVVATNFSRLAALAQILPALVGYEALAEEPPEAPRLDFAYHAYEEDDLSSSDLSGDQLSDRYDIDVLNARLLMPVGDHWSVGD